jgi:hypothetical protein
MFAPSLIIARQHRPMQRFRLPTVREARKPPLHKAKRPADAGRRAGRWACGSDHTARRNDARGSQIAHDVSDRAAFGLAQHGPLDGDAGQIDRVCVHDGLLDLLESRHRLGRANFVHKFSPELKSNATELKRVAARKKINVDVLVTEIANRTAQQPAKDTEFCSRQQRALEWALTEKVTSLTEVPAPYDLGPEMKVFPCPKR